MLVAGIACNRAKGGGCGGRSHKQCGADGAGEGRAAAHHADTVIAAQARRQAASHGARRRIYPCANGDWRDKAASGVAHLDGIGVSCQKEAGFVDGYLHRVGRAAHC